MANVDFEWSTHGHLSGNNDEQYSERQLTQRAFHVSHSIYSFGIPYVLPGPPSNANLLTIPDRNQHLLPVVHPECEIMIEALKGYLLGPISSYSAFVWQ